MANEGSTKPTNLSNRCNIETTDDGLRVCLGHHEKSAGCEWEYYVPKDSLARVRGLLQRMIELLDECEDSESWRIKVGEWRESVESADIGKLDRVPLIVEIERETDSRWLADVPSVPGVMAYGTTRADAAMNALILLDNAVAGSAETGGEKADV